VQSHAGWTLRFADGFGHRPNSVAPLAFDGNLGQAIAAVETAYQQRNLKPMFQITPRCCPVDLPEALRRRGYRAEGHSKVYVAKTIDVIAACEVHDVSGDAKADFERLVLSGSHSPGDGRERLDVLARIRLPQYQATAMLEGSGRACGHGSAAKDLVAINLVRTQPDCRRRGLARQVLGAIARWAASQHSPTLYLCVEENNASARTLYERIGFKPVYGYHYLRKD
jgi:GNAT superfamily N-acetyltransferase